jgi:hypothetical protein
MNSNNVRINATTTNISSISGTPSDHSTGTVKDPTTFTFGLVSEYTKRQQQEKINKQLLQMKIFNEIVSKAETPFTDPAGNRITNATTENLWFRSNVAFIFSIGSIFSEADQHKFSEILQIFQQTDETGKIASARTDNCSFLLNAYKVSNYIDPFIKTLEQRMEIGNGNYHICLIPIVTTEDVNVLKHAPEDCYRYAGPVEKYCDWDAVFRYMSITVAKYGLLTDFVVMNADATATFQTPLSANTVKTQDVDGNDVRIRPDNNPNDISTRLLNPTVKFDELTVLDDEGLRLERDFRNTIHQKIGTRTGNVINGHMYRDGTSLGSKGVSKRSIQSRIHEDNQQKFREIQDKYGLLNDGRKLGIETRFNINTANDVGAPTYREFQLYDSEITYDKESGRNLLFNTSAEDRMNIKPINGERHVKKRKVKVQRVGGTVGGSRAFPIERTGVITGAVIRQ